MSVNSKRQLLAGNSLSFSGNQPLSLLASLTEVTALVVDTVMSLWLLCVINCVCTSLICAAGYSGLAKQCVHFSSAVWAWRGPVYDSPGVSGTHGGWPLPGQDACKTNHGHILHPWTPITVRRLKLFIYMSRRMLLAHLFSYFSKQLFQMKGKEGKEVLLCSNQGNRKTTPVPQLLHWMGERENGPW